MNQSSLLRAEVGVLRREVAALAEKLAGVGVAGDVLLVKGGVEVVSEDDGSLPTVLTDGMIYTDELKCDRAQIQNLTVHGLEVLGDGPVFGPTGCRGPPGYATNTGATGPSVSRFLELVDCPSRYEVGACLVGTPTGIAFGRRPLQSRFVCGGPLVKKRGVWCHEPGDVVFSVRLDGDTPVAIVLGLIGGDDDNAPPVRLKCAHVFLTPEGRTTTYTTTIKLPGGSHYQEAHQGPIRVPPSATFLQTTISNTTDTGPFIVHLSASQ